MSGLFINYVQCELETSNYISTVISLDQRSIKELIKEYPDSYCLANPGQEYIAYLRWGGTLKIDLRSARETDTFQYYWYDPSTGKSNSPRNIQGGALRFLQSPGGYPGTLAFKDWVLHVKKS